MLSHEGRTLLPGDQILRTEVHPWLGGQTQSGISPSSKVPIVMLFSDPAAGERHGYIDGWHSDGTFHYSGEGQRGDQVMQRGNKAIRDHAAAGRSMHLFQGSGKGRPLTYVGEFNYVNHYRDDEPETGNGPMRQVFKFVLRPTSDTLQGPITTQTVANDDSVDEVPVESFNTERATVRPREEPHESERREAALVANYQTFLIRAGNSPARKRIRPRGTLRPLFTDIYVPDTNTLIEAKGSGSREAIRMAIGQLYDYARFLDSPSLAVLLPEKPRHDLALLLDGLGISVIAPDGAGGFTTRDPVAGSSPTDETT